VGSDGFIFAAIPGKVVAVRPDGVKFRERSVAGNPIGALVATARRWVYVTTDDGFFGAIDFFCHGSANGCVRDSSHVPAEPYSTPPLSAYGSLYAGRLNGKVVKFLTTTSFQAGSAITAGPVIGPGGQILVGTQNGTLYSLTPELTLRWQRNLGTAIYSFPAFSSDALYVVNANSLRAYNPFSGAPLWSRALGNGTGNGSVAVGYGRELYAQTTSGKVFGYNEGWSNQVVAVSASEVQVNPRIGAIQIEWQVNVPPVPPVGGGMQALSPAQGNSILLQRRASGEPWSDLAILPPGTTIYTDTSVLPDVEYAYRMKTLDAEGNDSDYTTTLVTVQSLPALPQAPVLASATATAADAVLLQWNAPAGAEVSEYRIERSADGSSFTPVSQSVGDLLSLIDSGLTPATAYFYRVIALNAMGESQPSNVLNVTTFQQTLPPPQNVSARLQEDKSVEINWTGGPEGAKTVIEVSEEFLDEYGALAEGGSAGPYQYYPGEPSTYLYRLKFVQGNNESPWVESAVVTIAQAQAQLFLPVTSK
jgi:hypothetical protein